MCYIYIYIYIYEAQTHESMICIHVVDIVMSRPMIFHNDNTGTFLLQDTRTTFTNVNTSDLYVNGWADLGG